MESPGPGPSMGGPSPSGQPFTTRFQVPIAQAPANQPALAQPVTQQQHMQGQQPQQPREQSVTHSMSPGSHPLRPPVANFGYSERDEPPMPQPHPLLQPQPPTQQSQHQSVRISQKPGPVPMTVSGLGTPVGVSSPGPGAGLVSQPPVTDAMPPRATWATEVNPHLSQQAQMTQFPAQPREARERPARVLESQLREGPRHAERAPVRLKQEPELVSHYETSFANSQHPHRVVASRPEPAQQQMLRQQHADQTRTVTSAPPQQPLFAASSASSSHPQAVRNLHSESVMNLQSHPQIQLGERGMALGIKPPMVMTPGAQVQDPYSAAATPVSQAPPASASLAPPRAPEPRKTSNLFALLNDDIPAAPPKRVADVSSGLKPSSTPPPQSMSARPPPPSAASTPLRREAEAPAYSYRNPGAPTSVMPSLKPYNTQSPQPHHSSIHRSSMVSPTDAAPGGPERGDYYSRHAYSQQHQQAANSPQGLQYLNQPQHAQQQSQMPYQSQSGYPPYGPAVSQQPHSTSPAPPFSAHQTPGGRREPGREQPQPQWAQPGQQALAPAQQQPDRGMQHQSTAWPSNQPAPKANQTPSPWAAQHGGHGASIKPQQPTVWTQAPQAQQQQHPSLSLRDDLRGQPVYGGHDQRPQPGMVQHGHHPSLSGRYPAQQDARRQEQAGPPPQAQHGYGRYPASQPPQPQRDHGPPQRSYTPTNVYDPRGPPPSSGPPVPGRPSQMQLQEMQMREMQQRDMMEQQQQQQQREMQQQQQLQGRMQPNNLRPPGAGTDGFR